MEDMEECIDIDSEDCIELADDMILFGTDRRSPLSFDEMPTTHPTDSTLFDVTNSYNINIDDRQALAASPFQLCQIDCSTVQSLALRPLHPAVCALQPRSTSSPRNLLNEMNIENDYENAECGYSTDATCSVATPTSTRNQPASPTASPPIPCRHPTRVRFAVGENPSEYDHKKAPSAVGKSWTPEEDDQLCAVVAQRGAGKWTELAEYFERKNPKQCRERWHNILDPSICREPFSPAEDSVIISNVTAVGTKWSAIARQLPGRTDNHVKNRWNATLKKLHSHALKIHNQSCSPYVAKASVVTRTRSSNRRAVGCY